MLHKSHALRHIFKHLCWVGEVRYAWQFLRELPKTVYNKKNVEHGSIKRETLECYQRSIGRVTG